MISYLRGNNSKTLTFTHNHISFALKRVLNEPGEITMKDDDQSTFPLYLFVILLTFILITNSTYSQITTGGRLDNFEITFVVSKLQDKVLLDEAQVTFVKQVLQKYSADLARINNPAEKSYSKNAKQDLVNNTSRQIKSILDGKQKMKFEIIEDEWWACVKNEEKD